MGILVLLVFALIWVAVLTLPALVIMLLANWLLPVWGVHVHLGFLQTWGTLLLVSLLLRIVGVHFRRG